MLPKSQRYMIVLFFTFITLFSCSADEMATKKIAYNNLKEVPTEAWDRLAGKTIYFGHQSVGFNIIEGMRDLINEYPQIRLKIVRIEEGDPIEKGVFAHSTIGENYKPLAKMMDFAGKLSEGIGAKADIAGMKLCYLDINGASDHVAIFNNYKEMVTQIHRKYPGLTIIHFTSPLVKRQTGVKAWIKKIIGKPITGVDDNIKRNDYNEMLRNEFKSRNTLFDLAGAESTYPDGTRSSFEKDGKTYYSLVPQYTYDDGHLNEIGRKRIAEKFLAFIVSL